MGIRRRQAIARRDWETSHHGAVKHGPTMGSPTKRSQENAPDSRTAVRCPHASGLTLRPLGS